MKMIALHKEGVYIINGNEIIVENSCTAKKLEEKKITISKEEAKKNTISYEILKSHNVSYDMDYLRIKFDSIASHDITYVSIIQTAKASGMEEFPLPYILTNCHNSLCATGGTINEDDHIFGLTSAKKYGGIYVPPHVAVIHQYMRETMVGCGKMILGSDSHTRYGALGTMAIGEGGGELVKQLLQKTYDISYPKVIGVYLTGKVKPYVGPQDVALAIIGSVFKSGFVKNSIMEFLGDGIADLSIDYRNGIDVMTTETTCLSSIWKTDTKVRDYYEEHGKLDGYKELAPGKIAYYDGLVYVNLSSIKPMIAMPFHPSNVYTIDEFNDNKSDILRCIETKFEKENSNNDIKIDLLEKVKGDKFYVDQCIIAGCAGGTHENICNAADVFELNEFSNCSNISIYPASQAIYSSLVRNGALQKLVDNGIIIKTAFCGPCFGAGDIPGNNQFSIRHTTRNFPSREGSQPANNQMSFVALMDSRSIMATAINGGILTSAENINCDFVEPEYRFDTELYSKQVYNGYGKPDKNTNLITGPNITNWPKMEELTDDIIIRMASVIFDEVTTTDELIPSGETSSYRSNPMKLADFTLSRKDPEYVEYAKSIMKLEMMRKNQNDEIKRNSEFNKAFNEFFKIKEICLDKVSIGSAIFANMPGDGSAREQAASCQKVLGGLANVAHKYATKRYMSNLINWGIVPFLINNKYVFERGDFIFISDIKKSILKDERDIVAHLFRDEKLKIIEMKIPKLTRKEQKILIKGSLINYYNCDASTNFNV